MFSKSDFQKAQIALTNAEKKLSAQKRLVADADAAIADTVLELEKIREAAIGQNNATESDSFTELVERLERNREQEEKLEARIEQYQRARAAKLADMDVAKLAVFQAETAIHAAQKAAWEDATNTAAARLWESMRTPLWNLIEAASALAYHQSLEKGEASAKSYWSDQDAESVLDAYILPLAEKSEFLSTMSIDTSPKGIAPVLAVRSALLDTLDRQAAQTAKHGDEFDPKTFKASMAVFTAPPKEVKEDRSRFSKYQQVSYWSDRVEMLERSLEHINDPNNDRYTFVDAAHPVSREPIRAKDRQRVEALLTQARENLKNWQADQG